MPAVVRVACIQNCAEREIAPNIGPITVLVRSAAKAGADLIALPEMAGLFEPIPAKLLLTAPPEAADPLVAACRDLAREAGTWILLGSQLFKEPGRDRVVNRSLMINPAGEITARYDKLHLFDVDLARGESYKESATVEAGQRAQLAATPWGLLGMSICYDLRFAYLYRSLAQAGAALLAIPAAFTYTTGKAHWHVLVRARAIETGCFVIAPNQTGLHAEGRRTFGHSLIVDPWGEVLADGGEDVGFVIADLDLGKVAEARQMIPALRHDRDFPAPAVPIRAEAMAGE
jgi:predicted amidohydrolase